jgi:hypothetical protein
LINKQKLKDFESKEYDNNNKIKRFVLYCQKRGKKKRAAKRFHLRKYFVFFLLKPIHSKAKFKKECIKTKLLISKYFDFDIFSILNRIVT